MKEHAELMAKNRALFSLYGIAQTMGNAKMSFDAKIQRIAQLVPQGFQYPEFTWCTISTDNDSICSNKILQDESCTPHAMGTQVNIIASLSERIFVNGIQRGKVELFQSFLPDTDIKDYAIKDISQGTKPSWSRLNSTAPPNHENHEGYFYGKIEFNSEEQNLVRTVARHIAVIMEKKELEEKEARLMTKLNHSDRLAKTGELAAGIAHELNNPLGNILGYAQLAAKTQDLPVQVNQDLNRIIQITLHAREVIRKLMFFSRQMPPRTELLDIRIHLENILEFMESMCNKNHVTVIRNYHDNPSLFSFDPSHFIQIMMNLIMNALHAMPQGGTLEITTYEEKEHLFLIVKDSGIGMDQDTLRQIFIPFFTTKSLDQGTGLGLSVVQGILDSHSASIDVTSQKGKGSVFRILFALPSNECFQ
ncbi:MAG: hypothetical protein HQK62_14910 [Desulfamplus sp.]|nr:hypothetical protein [Desulfamplus sp.]